MEYSWNEAKRQETIGDRKLDFKDASLFFDGRPMITVPTPRSGERRWKTTAAIEEEFYTVVWMWRDAKIQLISMRRAHDNEEKSHPLVHR